MTDMTTFIVAPWWQWMTQVSAQVLAVFAVVALLDRLLSRWAWPQLLRVLWLVVMLKRLVPPTLSLPVSVSQVVPTPIAASPQAAPTVAADHSLSALPPIALLVWGLGVIVVAAWSVLRYRAQKRMLLLDAVTVPDWLHAVAQQQADCLGLRRLPVLCVTPLCVVPFATPITQPTTQPATAVAPATRPPGCLLLRYQVLRMIAKEDAAAGIA